MTIDNDIIEDLRNGLRESLLSFLTPALVLLTIINVTDGAFVIQDQKFR